MALGWILCSLVPNQLAPRTGSVYKTLLTSLEMIIAMPHGRTYYFRVLLGYICSLLLSFRRQRIQPGAEWTAANFLDDCIEFTPIQPNSAALMAAIEREALEGIPLEFAGTFGTATRRFDSLDLSKLPAEFFQHLPIPFGKVNVFFGFLHKSHGIAKSILFIFHISHLHGFTDKERSFGASRRTILFNFC